MSVDNLEIVRGDTWEAVLLELGNITGFTELWFTAKETFDDTDVESRILIQQTVGLVYLNGAAATAGLGSITVDDAALGNITIALDQQATAALLRSTLIYDVQVLLGGAVTTLRMANVKITGDVTRAVS